MEIEIIIAIATFIILGIAVIYFWKKVGKPLE
jgi:uncharacterized protein YoxC